MQMMRIKHANAPHKLCRLQCIIKVSDPFALFATKAPNFVMQEEVACHHFLIILPLGSVFYWIEMEQGLTNLNKNGHF